MKKTFISTWHKAVFFYATLFSLQTFAQSDTLIHRISKDSSVTAMNMDAIYDRPFFSAGKIPVAIGGYMDVNTQYESTGGVDEGFSFQMRKLSLMIGSSISSRVKFLSEIEFEDGGKEIGLEYCALDFQFHPMFNLRGGIILNPIGGYNQNHDSPRWDFIDKPFSATGIIPTTLSNVGMGVHGKYFYGHWSFGYEFYLTNGFDDKIIDNDLGRTSLSEGHENAELFEESNSGLPLVTGKLAIRNRKIGEIGFSYMTGVYNKWKEDGLIIDRKRSAGIFAIDFTTALCNDRLNITGEYAYNSIDIPDSYTQQYGNKQWGFFTDVVYTFYQGNILGWDKAKLNAGLRSEYADYNVGTFRETGTNIGDDVISFCPSLAFRPTGSTVIRFNYRIESAHDLFDNEAVKTNVIQFGFSSYF
ncbi:MAG: hypothetical protein U0X76_05265 [Bacteroidia bacterium]